MPDRSTLRIALRTLGRHRGFTVVAVLSIAIAIALNTTMYSTLDAMLDPRISARQPDHIYQFFYSSQAKFRPHPKVLSDAMRAGLPGFEAMTFVPVLSNNYQLAENGPRYARISAVAVQPDYFDFLGTPPMEGRTFLPRDQGNASIVISDRLATKLFPDRSAVSRTVVIDGTGFTVIGVVRRNSTFGPLSNDVWVLNPGPMAAISYTLIRFRERFDKYEVKKQLNSVAPRIAEATGARAGQTAFIGGEFALQKLRIGRFHWALMGAVAAVLLVACANLANLQLARGLARSRELALRSAVGASRGQIIGHFLLETVILAAAGLALGVVLTFWGVHILKATMPPGLQDVLIEPQTSWKMFVFAATAAVVCLFLVGLLPALRISRVNPDELLKSSAGTGANRHHRRRYGFMVVAQIGFSLPVLIGAIVLIQRMWLLHSREYLVNEFHGYDPAPIVNASVPFGTGTTKADSSVRVGAVAAEIISRAKTIPGVQDAAVFMWRSPAKRKVTVDDAYGVVREEPAPQWSYNVVTPSYFRVLGLPIIKGRDFSVSELTGEAVIVDAPTARYLWGNDNPLGRMIKFGDAASNLPWHTIVGVVGDLRDTFAIRRRDPTANFRLKEVYRVMTPRDSLILRKPTPWDRARGEVDVYARVRGNTELAAIRMQRTLRTASSADKTTAIPLEYAVIGYEREQNDFAASIFGTFAFIGLGLVAIGLYGIVSHSVAERRRELAVRISLGATARNILYAVLREGNVLILAGIAIGLLLIKPSIFWLARLIDEDNDPYNALLFAAIAAGLFAIAVISAFVPAWRATRIDPVEALRSE